MSDLGLRPGDLEIERTSDGASLTLRLHGELDLATGPELVRELEDPRSADFAHIVIDLGGVDFMDSSGLQCLIAAQQAAEAHQQRLSLRPGGPQVQRLFELTRALDHFTFED